MKTLTYLDGSRIAEHKQTDTPNYGLTVFGYSIQSGAPTSHMIRLEGERRYRRVMVWIFSNVGTLFVRINGEEHIIHDYDLT